MAFDNRSAPGRPAASSRAQNALLSGKCRALRGLQAKDALCSAACSRASRSAGTWSGERACEGASGGEAAAGAEPGERCSLLLLKSQPKGSVFAQLLVASSGLLLVSQDSTWHVWEPILEKEQEGLACRVICNA